MYLKINHQSIAINKRIDSRSQLYQYPCTVSCPTTDSEKLQNPTNKKRLEH